MIKSVWKFINIIAISHKRGMEQAEIIDTFWTYHVSTSMFGYAAGRRTPPASLQTTRGRGESRERRTEEATKEHWRPRKCTHPRGTASSNGARRHERGSEDPQVAWPRVRGASHPMRHPRSRRQVARPRQMKRSASRTSGK